MQFQCHFIFLKARHTGFEHCWFLFFGILSFSCYGLVVKVVVGIEVSVCVVEGVVSVGVGVSKGVAVGGMNDSGLVDAGRVDSRDSGDSDN